MSSNLEIELSELHKENTQISNENGKELIKIEFIF